MPISVDGLSRFKNTEPVILNGIETFGLWAAPKFIDPANLSENQIITMSIGQDLAGRPDQIALQVYGTPALEWIPVMFNRPLNPLGWPQAGSVIKLPSKSAVLREL